MKLAILSVLGGLGISVLGVVGSDAGLMLQDCHKIDPSHQIIKRCPKNEMQETRRLAQWCRSCRRRGACAIKYGYNMSRVSKEKLNRICECIAVVQQRPIYIIANSVLESQNIAVALDHGANAIEIDVTAWGTTWWADRSGNSFSWGDSVEEMFKTIAQLVKAGRYIGFVWLQIQNPNYCKASEQRSCSVGGLRDLVHRHLWRIPVPVLYAFPRNFYSSEDSGALEVTENLLPYEAVAFDGHSQPVQLTFGQLGPGDERKRVMTDGYFDWATGFWPWRDEISDFVKGQAFQRVFGWTYAGGRPHLLDAMMDTGIDGIVYGFKHTAYYEHEWVRRAAQEVREWIYRHPYRARVATKGDVPW
ncbi:hypothetical protein CDD82_7835 [Ophiocordyceps australis]|uniref:Uncharacterized protein n=1 Tax=Ophiocordyceps australis TaxID=1399860 RepID=A0A2C5ZPQ4_9HYPO|nr:hypothetical protein CDD82_7835 [Ophiocordyceps australis]